jgi:hypothetical protein
MGCAGLAVGFTALQDAADALHAAAIQGHEQEHERGEHQEAAHARAEDQGQAER